MESENFLFEATVCTGVSSSREQSGMTPDSVDSVPRNTL